MDFTLYSSPTDPNDQLTNDSYELTRRARQDLIRDSRLVCPRLVSPFSGRSEMVFPVAPSTSASGPISPPATKSFPSLPALASSSSFKKRRVLFGGRKVINEGPEESISDGEVQRRWWTQNDLDEIKRRAKDLSIRLRQQAKQKGCYIELAHKKTSLMLTNNFPELVKLSPSSPDQDLKHWCARSDGRRGLERFASREYGLCRKDDVLDARDAVLQEQERQRQKKVYSVDSLANVSTLEFLHSAWAVLWKKAIIKRANL